MSRKQSFSKSNSETASFSLDTMNIPASKLALNDSLDRSYLQDTKQFFKNFLPSKSTELLEKLVFVILKKFNQFGMKHAVIEALAANFSKSNSMNIDHAKLICWTAAVRFLIQNDPNPNKIQEFVQQYPYLLEYNLFSNERRHLQRFERAMYYLSTTDIPFQTEKTLILRICKYFEQASVINIDSVDNNRLSIFERYAALHNNPLPPQSNSSHNHLTGSDHQCKKAHSTGNLQVKEDHDLTILMINQQERPEIVRFAGSRSNPESPVSFHAKRSGAYSYPTSSDSASFTSSPEMTAMAIKPVPLPWRKMSHQEIGQHYEVILDSLTDLAEIDAFASRIYEVSSKK